MRKAGLGRSVVQVVRPTVGGMRVHLELLLSALDSTRYRPILVSPTLLTGGTGWEWFELPLRDGMGPGDVESAWLLYRILRRIRPDIAHIHGRKALLLAAPVLAMLGIPYVYTVHGFPLAFRSPAWERFWLRRAEAVLAVSSALGDWVQERLGVRPVVIGNALRPQALAHAWRGRLGGPRLITVGRLAKEKGIDLLLEALADLPEAQLMVIGSGPEENALRTLAGRLGLDQRIGFLGEVPEPWSLMADADAYVQPSRSEGFGLAVLEAMAIGLPVLAARVGGLTDLLGNGERGWLFPPGDPSAIREALRNIGRGADAPKRLAAARAFARAQTPHALAARIMDVYDGVLDVRR